MIGYRAKKMPKMKKFPGLLQMHGRACEYVGKMSKGNIKVKKPK